MLNQLRQAKVFCWYLTAATKIRVECLPIPEFPVASRKGELLCSNIPDLLSKLSQVG